MKKGATTFLLMVLGITMILVAVLVVVMGLHDSTDESTWPESMEFSQLESGQDRFSIHDTNVSDFKIIVDHQTGIEYLYGHDNGMTPLLGVQGKPLRVFEAG